MRVKWNLKFCEKISKIFDNFFCNIETWAVQKHVNLVDLVESFPTILKRSFLSMYVIATVSCPNFHFSASPHVPFLNLLFEQTANSNEYVPFLNLLFEQIANSNEYLLAKFGFDTAENEPCKVCPLSAYRSPRWRASGAGIPSSLRGRSSMAAGYPVLYFSGVEKGETRRSSLTTSTAVHEEHRRDEGCAEAPFENIVIYFEHILRKIYPRR